jgi:hypothetical protein
MFVYLILQCEDSTILIFIKYLRNKKVYQVIYVFLIIFGFISTHKFMTIHTEDPNYVCSRFILLTDHYKDSMTLHSYKTLLGRIKNCSFKNVGSVYNQFSPHICT